MQDTETPGQLALVEWLSQDNSRTQKWLAQVLRVSQSTVSIWLRGKSRPPVWIAVAIQALTGIPVDAWLIEEERRSLASISVEAHRLMEARLAALTRRRGRVDARQMPFAFEPTAPEERLQKQDVADGIMAAATDQEPVVEIPTSEAVSLLMRASGIFGEGVFGGESIPVQVDVRNGDQMEASGE